MKPVYIALTVFALVILAIGGYLLYTANNSGGTTEEKVKTTQDYLENAFGAAGKAAASALGELLGGG